MTGNLVGLAGLAVALSAGSLVGCGGDYSLGRADSPNAGEGGDGGEGETAGTGGAGKAGSSGGAGKGAGGTPGKGGSSSGGSGADPEGGEAGEEAGGAPSAGSSGAGGGGTGGAGGTGLAGTGGTPTSASPIIRIREAATEKVDLLFMIDNSISMADKQRVLAEAVPVLLERLVTPRCVDALGEPTGTVADSNGACAQGAPEFPAVQDIHVGIITSALGHHGGDICRDATEGRTPDDKAQLLGSVRSGIPTNEDGFLSWQPGQDTAAFALDFANQVAAAGELGCGYESSLEAWYRFLVDPDPVDTITVPTPTGTSVRTGVNQTVLDQRAAFLRPDSLLAIIMLTDENDCSILDENNRQGWLVGYTGGTGSMWRMPVATESCAEDPNSECCRPCVTAPAAGCPSNEAEGCPESGYHPIADDSMNQRCFNQRGRFGIDFLYPTERYVSALRDTLINPRLDGNLVPNPLFEPTTTLPGRARDMVYLGGIVGVPWQDLATPESLEDPRKLEYLPARELWESNRWGLILGDPDQGALPTDPLMIESIDPRPTGAPHPLVAGAAIAASDSTSLVNVINGHEQAVLTQERDDLQFACIFPLDQGLQCTDGNADGCDCDRNEADKNSPLCDYPTPGEHGVQRYAKAYPGLRQLEVLKGLGDQALVASICPKNTTATGDPVLDPDYGYNPAISGILDRLREGIGPSCIERELPTAATASGDQTTCTVIEAHRESSCECDEALGRLSLESNQAANTEAIRQLEADGQCGGSTGIDCSAFCLCEIRELDGAALEACQNDLDATTDAHGFCYIDGLSSDVNPAIVRSCPGYAKRALRFAGEGVVTPGAFALLACPQN